MKLPQLHHPCLLTLFGLALLLSYQLYFTRPTSPLPYIFYAATPPSHSSTCASDYDPCGGAFPTPVRNLQCCSPDFYCYTQGPYFTQCRPLDELNPVNETTADLPSSRIVQPRCATDYAHCASLCCNLNYTCIPTTTSSHHCLPAGEKWYWISVHTPKSRFPFRLAPIFAPDQLNRPAVPLLIRDKSDYRYETWHQKLVLSIVLPLNNDAPHALREHLSSFNASTAGTLLFRPGVAYLTVSNISQQSHVIPLIKHVAKLRWVANIQYTVLCCRPSQ